MVASKHPALLLLADDGQSGGRIWRFKLQRPVWTVLVVVPDVDPKDLLEVAAPNNEQPVQALGADRAHPALRVRVGSGRPHWREEYLGAFVADNVVEGAGELRVVVPEQVAQPSSSFSQHQHQVATLLSDPAAVRVGGHTRKVNSAGLEFDKEQHVQPLEPHRLDGEEVARHDAGSLLA